MTHASVLWLIVAAVWLGGADRITYYDISGASARELREALNRLRPSAPDGTRHDAATAWRVEWRYKYESSQSDCGVASLNVTTDVHVTLPKWTNEADAPSSLVQRWREYYSALLIHEEGHKAIGSSAAAAIREALPKVARQPTCAALGEILNGVAQGLLDDYRRKEREYDKATDHGRTQGARFP